MIWTGHADLYTSFMKFRAENARKKKEAERLEVREHNRRMLKLKKIYTENDFDHYKTEEEEVGKVIRCILNFLKSSSISKFVCISSLTFSHAWITVVWSLPPKDSPISGRL